MVKLTIPPTQVTNKKNCSTPGWLCACLRMVSAQDRLKSRTSSETRMSQVTMTKMSKAAQIVVNQGTQENGARDLEGTGGSEAVSISFGEGWSMSGPIKGRGTLRSQFPFTSRKSV